MGVLYYGNQHALQHYVSAFFHLKSPYWIFVLLEIHWVLNSHCNTFTFIGCSYDVFIKLISSCKYSLIEFGQRYEAVNGSTIILKLPDDLMFFECNDCDVPI